MVLDPHSQDVQEAVGPELHPSGAGLDGRAFSRQPHAKDKIKRGGKEQEKNAARANADKQYFRHNYGKTINSCNEPSFLPRGNLSP